MNRDRAIARLRDSREPWDVLIIGGGATGLGAAVDAAARGLRTALVEQHDFAKGTSSRSTKLIHGGVRYLRQGQVALVRESLRERGRLLRNAPHLVHSRAFVIPNHRWWEGPYYGLGLKLYDWFAGDLGLEPSRHLSRAELQERLPTLKADGLRGGVLYHDGQFDDARLALALARTADKLGGVVANYVQVTALRKENGRVRGALARDVETGEELELPARVVINAAGPFSDPVRRMDEPGAAAIIAASQGAHLILGARFLPGETAVLVPHTEDGRVLFMIPWQGRVVVGTTDTPVAEAVLEPRALESEIDFLLEHAGKYLARKPASDDILSVTAGLRPLVRLRRTGATAKLPRDHAVLVSASGLVSIVGGKWTTYRKMAADVVDRAMAVAGLKPRLCVTEELRLHGAAESPGPGELHAGYGSEAAELLELERAQEELGEPLHPKLPYVASQMVWAARHEMARTLEDVLARRTRALLLDARASLEAAPAVAALIARELGRDAVWEAAQVRAFGELARQHLPPGN